MCVWWAHAAEECGSRGRLEGQPQVTQAHAILPLHQNLAERQVGVHQRHLHAAISIVRTVYIDPGNG